MGQISAEILLDLTLEYWVLTRFRLCVCSGSDFRTHLLIQKSLVMFLRPLGDWTSLDQNAVLMELCLIYEKEFSNQSYHLLRNPLHQALSFDHIVEKRRIFLFPL